MIVLAIASPRTRWHVLRVHELPVRHIRRLQQEIITHRGRNIQTRAMVQVGLGTLTAENILKMIGAKRAAIFPLGVAGAVAFANRDPAMPAN